MFASFREHRGAFGRPFFPFWAVCLFFVASVAPALARDLSDSIGGDQIEEVRREIRELEASLDGLDHKSESTREERERLAMELDLAEARVEELELVLTKTRNEAVGLKEEIHRLAVVLEERKRSLATHLELMLILGRPGPLQLLWDAARGGDLEEAVTMVVTMASGQARIVEEFNRVRTQRTGRLAELSITLDRAGREAEELVARRGQLQSLRREVESRLSALERQRRATGDRLVDLREREENLERLFGIVSQQRRFTGKEDIRRFRGALPWPAEGKIITTFGKHYLPKYATYTVCNGLRLVVDPGTAVACVFPGQVAYARHFKGYGNMVVVDHGNEVFSLVAGLGSIQARLNQQVDLGSQLGVVGPKTEDGNLYFEVRVDGKPVDPRRWLQLAEGK